MSGRTSRDEEAAEVVVEPKTTSQKRADVGREEAWERAVGGLEECEE